MLFILIDITLELKRAPYVTAFCLLQILAIINLVQVYSWFRLNINSAISYEFYRVFDFVLSIADIACLIGVLNGAVKRSNVFTRCNYDHLHSFKNSALRLPHLSATEWAERAANRSRPAGHR